MGKPTKSVKLEQTHQNAIVCLDTTRKGEDGSLGTCTLGARGYHGNILVWAFGHLLGAKPEIMHQ